MDFALTRPEPKADQGEDSYSSIYGELYSKFPMEAKTAGTLPLNMLKVTQSSHETHDPAVEQVVFRLVLESEMSHSSVDCGNGKVTLSGRPGSFYLAPAHEPSYWEGEGDHRLLMLALPKVNIDRLMEAEADGAALRSLEPLYNRDIFNGAIPGLMNRIWDHSVQDGPGASLLVDGLFVTLLGTLVSMAEVRTSKPRIRRARPLDDKRLRAVTDFVDANLEEHISLEDMASVACQSLYHFCRCFKLSTNTTPHMFVSARRIERARHLLTQTSESLAEIAYACGFSSQAYFTTKFREHTCMTPGAYRAAMRS
ncbi:MAG: AraC family transcriptional regulator [Pseudomonadota bacterium]